jgi:hypothetical protein
MRKYLLGAAMLAILAAPSCKKDKNMKKAVVVDSGDIATGGCGYLVKLEQDGKLLRPKYLPSAYQHDGEKVKLKFNADGEGEVCQTNHTNQFIEIIEITDIKKDLD